MRDFTLDIYKELLMSLREAGYHFITFSTYVKLKTSSALPVKFIILRHDVDDLPQNSLEFANIQAKMGVNGTFYFRIVPESFNKDIIRAILNEGHEVGYHYETMDTSSGDVQAAYDEFLRHLKTFSSICKIESISMHGSPISKHDNRDIWTRYNYKDLGIIGEPYFDFDFNAVYYITDTGRTWNGHKYNIRDKAPAENPLTNPDFIERNYRSTQEIIQAISNSTFPDKVMMNFHPERWTDNKKQWIRQFVMQKLKNQVKRLILLVR